MKTESQNINFTQTWRDERHVGIALTAYWELHAKAQTRKTIFEKQEVK